MRTLPIGRPRIYDDQTAAEVVRLRDIEGGSWGWIAREIGIPVGSARALYAKSKMEEAPGAESVGASECRQTCSDKEDTTSATPGRNGHKEG